MADDLITLSQLLDDARTALRSALTARDTAATQLATAQAAVNTAKDRLAKIRTRVSALLDAGADPVVGQ